VGFPKSAQSVWPDLRGRVLAIALSALIIMAFMLWFEGSSVTRVSGVQTIGVGVYREQNCSNAVASIDWGVLNAGAVKNTIVYVRNEGTQPTSLNVSTTNWNPSTASNYLKLGWDYSGRVLDPNEVLKVTLTLSVSSTASISSAGFDLIIAAGAPTPQYGLLVAVTGSGTTNATGTAVYSSGANVAVKATTASGWTLSNWLLNGSSVGSANPYVLTMNANYSLTAVFVSGSFGLVVGVTG
jgi:hypothetical protein